MRFRSVNTVSAVTPVMDLQFRPCIGGLKLWEPVITRKISLFLEVPPDPSHAVVDVQVEVGDSPYNLFLFDFLQGLHISSKPNDHVQIARGMRQAVAI